MTDRRTFCLASGAALLGLTHGNTWADTEPLQDALRDIETKARGRLGVHLIDTATGREQGWRMDERFLMLSSFKLLASALVLDRADRGEESLERRIRYRRQDLVSWSPVTERHVGGEGLSLAQLCEATITTSDNTAANLILASYGGPGALTAYARRLGDRVTRLDRTEPELNRRAASGEPLDTTTPRAMAHTLRALLVGDALSPASRARLLQWLLANTTGGKRLRAGVPADWRIGEKTGTAGDDANDIGIAFPPQRAPVIVTAYLAESVTDGATREAALASVGRLLAKL
ncbi:MAG: class A beta-lactamase [Hydrogenophaga sp.]|uniref:class A beta-lactamase n=1 Tax=Hydrogenophaga sp. TaxID=1904254 RepID=UPI0025BED63F|nr:class A beta-lactamase [Hydrogenophaga sp.]MBU7573565.1 class A beta-lactamase [Hydrogenophaga sp.]